MSDVSTSTPRVDVVSAVRAHIWALTVWTALTAWAVGLFAIMRDHYVHYRLARFDLGNMVQAVWSTTQGRPLDMTDGASGEQVSRLAFHVDPILALLAPLWIVFPTPLMLVAVQVVAIALGALPVFWLARKHSGSERVAALLALAYLAYPWTAWAGVDVFHPISLSLPLLLYAVWFLDSDRLVPFAVVSVLAAASGELVGLTIAALGLWYAFGRGRRWPGLATAAAGIGWSLIAVLVVVPAFAGGDSPYYGAYANVGGSPTGLLKLSFTEPMTIVAEVTRRGDLAYLGLLIVPLIGAFALAPGLAAVALPQVSLNLLAGFAATTDVRAHYTAPVLACLFAATAVGVDRLRPRSSGRVAATLLAICAATTLMLGPWPLGSIGKPKWWGVHETAEEVAVRDAAIALVPRGAPVSASNTLGAHLADRRYLASVPTWGEAEWVVIDVNDTWRPLRWGGGEHPEEIRAALARLKADPTWALIFSARGVYVFRKVGY